MFPICDYLPVALLLLLGPALRPFLGDSERRSAAGVEPRKPEGEVICPLDGGDFCCLACNVEGTF